MIVGPDNQVVVQGDIHSGGSGLQGGGEGVVVGAGGGVSAGVVVGQDKA